MPFDLLTFLEPLFNLLMAAASAAVLALVPPLVKMFLQKIKLDVSYQTISSEAILKRL